MSSVGVVIPCYNYGHLLADSVGSVLSQPGVDVRVLIIDDASPDGSAEAARAIAATDSRISVRVHEKNMGHIATYNEGLLDWCDSEYAVLLSADDMLTPGSLRRAVQLMDANPNVGFAYGHYVRFTESRQLPPVRLTPGGWTIWSGSDWLRRRLQTAQGCIASPEVVVRTAVQRRVGGYDPGLPHTGDIEMWMRFSAHADVGYLQGVDQAYYRSHVSNMSNEFLANSGIDDLRQRRAAFEALFDKCGDRIPARVDGEMRVRKVLARDALVRAGRSYDRRRTETTPITELVAFAEDTYPAARRLPEYATLRVRQRIGARLMPYLQPLVVTAVCRKARNKIGWRRWQRTGV